MQTAQAAQGLLICHVLFTYGFEAGEIIIECAKRALSLQLGHMPLVQWLFPLSLC